MRIEQIKELGFFGHQSGKHWRPPQAKKHENFISLSVPADHPANW
jgi:hypothetical protein